MEDKKKFMFAQSIAIDGNAHVGTDEGPQRNRVGTDQEPRGLGAETSHVGTDEEPARNL